MKHFSLLLFAVIFFQASKSQQLYNDFETPNIMSFGPYDGILDTSFANIFPNSVNSSVVCARYIRDTSLYDNIKIYPDTKMVDVSVYANNSFQTPKMKIKVYSTAPAGTFVQLQLGSKSDDTYPSGVHSEYLAATTVQYAWETLTFNYVSSPSGSTVASTNVNKMVLFFNTGSTVIDTFYIDDIIGPTQVMDVGLPSPQTAPHFKLYQNHPNPARENTHISFQVNTPGVVSLKLYDLIGKPVATLVNQQMKPGHYTIPVETENIPEGIYFYILKKEGVSQSMKMTISK
jgi:hypothetical protein